MAMCKLGAYNGVCSANQNMLDIFRANEKEKDKRVLFPCIRKIAIETTPATKIKINDVDIVIPSTGIFEIGFGLIDITSLIFDSSENANIVYMF